MLTKYLHNFLSLVLLTVSPLALAQHSQPPKSRDVLVKESIANLDSTDIRVAAQAARDLGYLRATEGVPALLRVLQSSRVLSRWEHMPKDKNGMSLYVITDVKGEIINSLGLIGDRRAVPVLKRYLKQPLTNREVFTGNVAHALYRLTGKSYEYKDHDGEKKLYVPRPITEEDFRKRSRPDLKATSGLTASLEIASHGSGGLLGAYWQGDHPLVINLAITNQSNKVIEIDASADNFLFSSVAGSGERTDIPASLLPTPGTGAEIAVITPGQKFELRWVVETLKESPLSRGWSGYVNLKCVYTNPRKSKGGATWRGERLISNSVERYYYSTIEPWLDRSGGCAFRK